MISGDATWWSKFFTPPALLAWQPPFLPCWVGCCCPWMLGRKNHRNTKLIKHQTYVYCIHLRSISAHVVSENICSEFRFVWMMFLLECIKELMLPQIYTFQVYWGCFLGAVCGAVTTIVTLAESWALDVDGCHVLYHIVSVEHFGVCLCKSWDER